MAAYSANAEQTVQPGAFAVFTATVIPCEMGLIQHSDETPLFSLSGWRRNGNCPCNRMKPTRYMTSVNMNVALAEGATVEPIAVAIAIEGVAFPISEMDSTPAAVGDYNHIGTDVPIPILNGCCQNVAIQNIGTQPITIKNLLISFDRPDLRN